MFNFFFAFKNKNWLFFSFLIMAFSLLFDFSAFAADYEAQAEERKSMRVESNSYENWPLGPAIGAQAAILMDASTGAILYEKNIDEKLYPASITKLLTTYIAVQKCDLNEMVTFSQEAINSINWWEDANMGVNAGASLPLSEVLYGILVGSANEAAYAVAEHVSGSVEEFARLMNETARELGCTNSHFVTPNGIHDENHYTTARDMAIIAQAFFSNDTLAKISGTPRFEVPVGETQKREGIILTAKSQLLPGKPYAYDGLVGSKTGYTDLARQTLVSCASKEGMKLICVILKEEAPAQFTDTIALFDYGFDHFDALNISEVDNQYTIDNSFFTTDIDILGSSKPIIELDKNGYIILPNTIDFDEVSSKIFYSETSSDEIAFIHYYYQDIFLGKIPVRLAAAEPEPFDFGTQNVHTDTSVKMEDEQAIFINVFQIFLIGTVAFFLFSGIHFFRYRKNPRRGLRHRKKKLQLFRRNRYWNINRY